MNTKSDDLEYIHRIEAAIESAYTGLLPEFHMTLGKLMAREIAVWVPPESTEDVVNEIRNVRRDVDKLVEYDVHRSRYGKP